MPKAGGVGQGAVETAAWPVASPRQLRSAGTAFAAFAGAAMGLALGLTVSFLARGDAMLAIAALAVGIVIDLGAVTLMLLFRVVAQLVERRLEAHTSELAQRLGRMERELALLAEQVGANAGRGDRTRTDEADLSLVQT